MDKLSEYLPLVIILVSLVFTALGKKKKQGKITQETTLPGKTAGEFVDVWKLPQTMSGGSSSNTKFIETKPQAQPSYKQVNTKKKEVIPSYFSETINLESEEEKANPLFSLEGEDDIKKAIIYAEIINRREY